ncbi:HlyD family secretion protein [Crenobacter sp. SG2303]|uniref:HlyD family secretion protein n=1 Tax=Crenobacter oryzisoli TaxID=3056844 RepID=A0ABT7XQA6_9NEIS|nr:HlyD family secretion protein [Crenobacter sp. SG2303]MDN0075989.1 HlyD family secretion protein [Crenobacter sp. SG2303]
MNKPELVPTDTAPPGHAKPAPGGPASRKRRLILAVILLTTLAVAGRMAWRSHNFEETDNAYLAAHVSVISPRIAGVVHKVLVADNQLVRAGDPLVELDAADQQVKIAQIKAQIAQTDEQIRQMGEELKQADAEAQAAQALVARARAQWVRNDAEARRVTSLHDVQLKSVSTSELDSAVAARASATAEVQAQQFQAKAASAKSGAVDAARAAVLAQKKVLAAQLQDAELQLGYTRIVAPVDGRIGKKSIEVGARVQTGQQLLAIVQDGVWVTANFKETQLAGLFAGQQAKVKIDAFPGQEFTGKVDSFSPASGAQFSLLPPDNATGNFTKIVQRIPVKVLLDPKAVKAMNDRLAPGMSAVVEVDLRQGKPAAGAAR